MSRRLVILFICIISSIYVYSQQNHFMYIQSDDKAPFYVNMDGKSYVSSNTGYVIISRISSGKHDFTVGFTKTQGKEIPFTITIKDKDVGYVLKNVEDKGWSLVNLQTMEAITASSTSTAKTPEKETGKTVSSTPKTTSAPTSTTPATPPAKATTTGGNAFGDMLAQVVNDPTIKDKTVQQPVADSKKSTAKEVIDTEEDNPDYEDENVAAASSTKGVIKVLQKENKDGTDLIFIDFTAKGSDTIKIFLPASSTSAGGKDVAKASAPKAVQNDGEELVKTNPSQKDDPKFVGNSDVTEGEGEVKKVNNPFYSKPSGSKPVEKEKQPETVVTDLKPAIKTNDVPTSSETVKVATVNSNCNGVADEKDVDKLKKKMVGNTDDDKMIEIARKAFKSKCYTTKQIKEISLLFFTDDSRYKFYDAAYPFVYDSENFPSLSSMLMDDYYRTRFQAMLR